MKEKKVMQHYFWNWLTHNFCHTLERWGRYYTGWVVLKYLLKYRSQIFFFWIKVSSMLLYSTAQSKKSTLTTGISKTNLQIEKSYGDFLFPKEFRLTKSWKSLICKWVVKGRRIWQHLTVLAIQPPLPRSMILKSIKQKKNN